MADFRDYIGLDLTGYLMHYGVGHEHGGHSGRYPWGSGKRPKQDRGRSGQVAKTSVASMKSDSIHKSAIAAGFRPLPNPETREEALKNCNPYRGKFVGKDNCLSSSLSGYFREHGIDSKGRMRFDGSVFADEIMNNATTNRLKRCDRVIFDPGEEATAITKAISRMYGDNSAGLIMVRWQGGGGHVYNFETKGGKVSFIDYQLGQTGKAVDEYLDHVDTREPVVLYRLDNAELDMSKLKKYLKAS